jgi:hypothetical protein
MMIFKALLLLGTSNCKITELVQALEAKRDWLGTPAFLKTLQSLAVRNETVSESIESSFTLHYLNFGSWKSIKAVDGIDIFSSEDKNGLESKLTLDIDFENTSGSVFMLVD